MNVGDKVICIDDSIKAGMLGFVGHAYPNWIKKNTIYTIREIYPNDDIVPGVLLEEVENPIMYIHLLGKDQEPAFRLTRFREVDNLSIGDKYEEYSEFDLEGINDPLAI